MSKLRAIGEAGKKIPWIVVLKELHSLLEEVKRWRKPNKKAQERGTGGKGMEKQSVESEVASLRKEIERLDELGGKYEESLEELIEQVNELVRLSRILSLRAAIGLALSVVACIGLAVFAMWAL